jgi:TonB family protein
MRIAFGLMASFVVGGIAWADQPSSLFVHTTQPTVGEINAAYPAGALARKVSGKVALSCLVTADLQLSDCQVKTETPQGEGFAAAAITLTPRYRVRETDQLGQRVAGRRIPIETIFLAPGDSRLDWAKKPTSEQMWAVLPKLASDEGVGGKTSLHCTVSTEGALRDCTVEWEQPAGYGFGMAALKLTDQFRMKPATRGGRAVEDEVSIPIHFGAAALSAGAIAGLVRDPIWDAAPSAANVAAAYPAKAGPAIDGYATLRCGVIASGVLKDCKAISEMPKDKGFADAALKLAPRFRVSMSSGGKLDLTKYAFDVPIHFRDPALPEGRAIDRPTWTASINPAYMASLYPAAAVKAGVKSGVGEVNCGVDAEGRFSDCKVTRQQPDGLGFGDAALAVAQIMAMNRWTKTGDPVDGLRYTLPVRFTWKEPAAPPPPPPAKP